MNGFATGHELDANAKARVHEADLKKERIDVDRNAAREHNPER